MNRVIVGLFLSMIGGLLGACNKPVDVIEDAIVAFSHEKFDELLMQHVDAVGDVDYVAFVEDTTQLKTYLDYLAVNEPETTWSANKKMAYWINLYNAFTIYTILQEYPVNSILDIDNGMVWTQRMATVGDTAYTLDQIEKERLLATFNEPRVHFAVNCAAVSCPPLQNKAWTESNIQQYYTNATRDFINNTDYNYVSMDSLAVSKIFDWYAADFGGASNLVGYFQQYADSTIADSAVVTFQNYDWDLNGQ